MNSTGPEPDGGHRRRNGVRLRSLVAVLAVIAAAVLGACGDDDDTSLDTPTSDGSLDPPAGDANPEAPERRLLEPTPGLVDPIPSAIESYAELEGTTLELRFYSGVEECYGLDRVDVEELDATVTVTVFVGRRPEAEVCIEIAESVATKVDLAAPLAGRTLVDGSTGEPIPVD